MISDEILELK